MTETVVLDTVAETWRGHEHTAACDPRGTR